jgi:hypothetical protein
LRFSDAVATNLWLTYYLNGEPINPIDRNETPTQRVKALRDSQMLNFADTGGLFDHFEVNREPFWPRIIWLIAGSGAWHLVLLACIILVPPIRDALSIAAIFSGAGFVDRPYKHSAIGDDAEIIEFTTEKFRYPEGYFLMDGGLPPSAFPTPLPFNTQPATVTPGAWATPTPAATPIASPSAEIAKNTTDPKSPAASKTPDEKATQQAQKELDEASKKTGIELPEEGEINKAPFKDLATYATDLRDHGKLDFDKPFEVTIDTQLDKDGKLVDAHVTNKLGDENLIELSKRLIGAMNDSGVLFYLKKINDDKPGTKVIFTIKQDGKEVTATVESEVSSPDSANKLARGFAVLLDAGARSRQGKDEEPLLKGTKVSANGAKVVFKLILPRQEAVDIVKKGIASPAPTIKPG